MIYRSLKEVIINTSLDGKLRFILDNAETDTKILPECRDYVLAIWTDGSYVPNHACSAGLHGILYSTGFKNPKKSIKETHKLPYYDDIDQNNIKLYTIEGTFGLDINEYNTSQKGELQAIVEAFKTALFIEKHLGIKLTNIKILTDSQYGMYVIDKVKSGEVIPSDKPNVEFYTKIANCINQFDKDIIEVIKVKGHSCNIGNSKADTNAGISNTNAGLNIETLSIVSLYDKKEKLIDNEFGMSNYIIYPNKSHYMLGIDIMFSNTENYTTCSLYEYNQILHKLSLVINLLNNKYSEQIVSYNLKELERQDIVELIRKYGFNAFKIKDNGISLRHKNYTRFTIATIKGDPILTITDNPMALENLVEAEKIFNAVEQSKTRFSIKELFAEESPDTGTVLFKNEHIEQELTFGIDLPRKGKIIKHLNSPEYRNCDIRLELVTADGYYYIVYTNVTNGRTIIFYNYLNVIFEVNDNPDNVE